MARVRVYELAKELNLSSMDLLMFLQEEGLFIRTGSSILDEATVALVRNKAAAGLGPKKRYVEGNPLEALRAMISDLETSPGYAAGDPLYVEAIKHRKAWLANLNSAFGPAKSSVRAVTSESPRSSSAPALEGSEERLITACEIPASESYVFPEPGYKEFKRGATGVSFGKLLVPYLLGASEITITDPYIRTLHQARNLMELVEALLRAQDNNIRTLVRLRTSRSRDGDEKKDEAQRSYLDRIVSSLEGTNFSLTYILEPDLHGRTIVANSGWRISLDRGLDIYESVPSDPLNLGNRMQEFRTVKSFYVSYHALI